MRNCPTEKQLALFIEGKLTNTEARKMRQHIATCQQCAHGLVDLMELQDLEADGLLPTITKQEADLAFQALEKLIERPTETSSTAPIPTKGSTSELKSRLDDFLGGVVAVAGLTHIQEFMDDSIPNPGLAGKNEKNSSDFVRNESLDSSKLSEEDNSHNTAFNQGLESVNNNIYANVEPAPTAIGISGVDGKSTFIRQNYEDTCAIRSQELILRDFGVNVSEDTLRDQAITNGWYIPGSGTDPKDVGNLLEFHGVEVNRYENANIFTLTSELAKGNRIIIGVDSGELWNKGFLEEQEDLVQERADHALIVSGIDTSDPNNIKVVVTDPGSGDVAKEYPIEQFIDAWQDSNFFMVSTVEPAPLAFNPEMVNFDYALGHLSEIGNLPYEDFQQLFSPCMELELSNSLLSNQAELLTKYAKEGGFVVEHDDTLSTDEFTLNDDLEPLSVTIAPILDFSAEESSQNDEYDSPEDNYDGSDGNNFEDDLFE